jgi:hypothetical protein
MPNPMPITSLQYSIRRVLVAAACALMAIPVLAQQSSYPAKPATTGASPTAAPTTGGQATNNDCGGQGAQLGSASSSAPITGAGTNGAYGLKAPTNATARSHSPGVAIAPVGSPAYAGVSAGGYVGMQPGYRSQAMAQPYGQGSASLGVPQARTAQSSPAGTRTNCAQVGR